MHYVADMNADLNFDPAIGRDVSVAFSQCALNFNGTLRSFQCAVEFHEKGVADGLDLGAIESRKYFAEQLAMLFQSLKGDLFVALSQRAIAHHVGKHDGRELTLLGIVAHGSLKPRLRIIGMSFATEMPPGRVSYSSLPTS